MRTQVALALSVLLGSTAARAESYNFNFHVEPGVGFSATRGLAVAGAALKIDSKLLGIGPVALQIEGFGLGSINNSYLASGSAFGGGIGLRLRLIDDHEGYVWAPGIQSSGNAWGNLWLDAHFIYAAGGLGAGFDAALGYEFSLIEGLQVGPFGKFALIGLQPLVIFGLSFSIGTPMDATAEADDDSDGITNSKDKCPKDAEDKDSFQDEDGCPDKDNDNDGIEDTADKCPNDAGPAVNNGCPVLDKDGDGIPDDKDKCPADAEDKDGFQDDDGCPEKDNDGDGLLDATDKCPNEAGPASTNGCPVQDKDSDGIPDDKDQCPEVAETVNGIDDEDGCPEKDVKVFITKEKIVITDKVFFATGKTDILPKSNALLDSIAAVFTKFPNIKKVQVEGHTDDVGVDAKNLKLSEGRAASVVSALVKRGIAQDRLVAKGFGATKPLAQGKTEAAREQNRRVEFTILEQAPQ